MVERRCAGAPVEHIVGWVEFCGMRVAVDPGVFVPRRRTELLVWQAAALARRGAIVVDVCCGSGAVGAALARAVGRVELYAVDLDPAAVRCAQRNLEDAGGFAYEGDLFDPLPPRLQGTVDVIVANAPYVPTDEIPAMPVEAREHEPRVALDGGVDGLDIVRRIVVAAPSWLAPHAVLLVETSDRQAEATIEVMRAVGLEARLESDADLGGVAAIGVFSGRS
jgi:release factor glutamine methyltransferase